MCRQEDNIACPPCCQIRGHTARFVLGFSLEFGFAGPEIRIRRTSTTIRLGHRRSPDWTNHLRVSPRVSNGPYVTQYERSPARTPRQDGPGLPKSGRGAGHFHVIHLRPHRYPAADVPPRYVMLPVSPPRMDPAPCSRGSGRVRSNRPGKLPSPTSMEVDNPLFESIVFPRAIVPTSIAGRGHLVEHPVKTGRGRRRFLKPIWAMNTGFPSGGPSNRLALWGRPFCSWSKTHAGGFNCFTAKALGGLQMQLEGGQVIKTGCKLSKNGVFP